MTPPRPAGSLGRRLSWWLALQSLVVLLAVCAAAYAATALGLQARQRETLQQKHTQILHLLAETANEPDSATLEHKLDDYFVGHRDMTLVLTRADGGVFYRSPMVPAGPDERRELRFDAPVTPSQPQRLAARLLLDTRDDLRLLRGLAIALVASAFAGALVISAGGFVLVRVGLRPLHQLVEQTRRVAAGTLHRPLDGSAQPAELQPLIAQFNDLLLRLGRSYQQLEGFNADVAHELYTPLSTLISSVELAMRKPRAPEDIQELLGSNLEELQRMAGIIHDMLFLSQADRGSTARREQVASLAAAVAAVAEYHEAELEEAGLRLQIGGDAAGAFDLPLLRRALSNLISNATRYATRGSALRVEIGERGPDEVTLQVVNEGDTIDPAHLPRLFDRFYRADSGRRDGHRHHGLGLSIVAAVTQMHGGEPFARSEAGVTTIGMVLRQPRLPANA